jgi:hypothetical protein
MSDTTFDPGADTVGQAGPPVLNVSGSFQTVGATRHSMRGVDGRFSSKPVPHRKPVLIEAVSGRPMETDRDRSQLLDWDRVHEISATASAYPAFDLGELQAHSDRLAGRVAHRMQDDALVRGVNHNVNINNAKARQ